MKKTKNNNKIKKIQKIRIKANSYDYKQFVLLYGVYGLRALECIRLNEIQLNALKKTIKKIIKKFGILWLRVKAMYPVTQKPQQVRMGKGKGNFSHFVAIIKKGTILVELGGYNLPKKLAILALKVASQKLAIKTEICMYKI